MGLGPMLFAPRIERGVVRSLARRIAGTGSLKDQSSRRGLGDRVGCTSTGCVIRECERRLGIYTTNQAWLAS